MPYSLSTGNVIPLGTKLLIILLAGSLSMTFVEVFVGSSPLWFATYWGVGPTFWLYLAHFILLINLALIFKRTSFTSLYILGMCFGLYELWVTKVLCSGFTGSRPSGALSCFQRGLEQKR
jgi:hypothetical protein